MSEFDEYMSNAQQGRSVLIGPSGVGDCYRRHAYRYMQVPPSDERSRSAADLGTLLHLGWAAMIESQYDPADRAAEVEVHTDGMPRPGRADDVDYLNRIVTDLKSAKDRVWQSWLNNGGPYDSYWDQLEVYALGLRQQYGGVWTLRIVAFNRETGERAEYMREQDTEVAHLLVDRAGRRHRELSAAVAVTAAGADVESAVEAFPREGRGPGMGMPCDWCEFVSVCWPEPSVPGGTPQSETVREDAAALGAWAAEYVEASAAARKAEARRKDAQAFLRGVSGEFPGPDGGVFRVAEVGGGERETPDCERMRERLTELGEPIPMSVTRRASYPRVSRKKGS